MTMITDIAIQTITFVTFLAFAATRLMNYLHALQQDDYDNGRLISWIIKNGVFDKRVTAFLLIITGFSFVSVLPNVALNILIFFGFIFAAYFERDPRKQSKKALVLTQRAKRILGMGMVFTCIMAAGAFYFSSAITWIIAVHLLPLMLILGNMALNPHEASVQKKFYGEARQKIDTYNPTIIGITGSYGKTSVKHILGHILKTAAPTLITPGSVNTLMGITRIIREQLAPNHKYFIVEMGAYGPGSIASLCALTPPNVGIITAIGHAHYERFKTLETVAQAKYELAESVLSRNGTMVVHEKTLKFEHTRAIRHRAMDNFIVCGEPLTRAAKSDKDFSYLAPDDLRILEVEQTPKGLCVIISWKDENYTLRAPLYGIHHGHNIALAFACAMSLGMDAKDIKTALATTPQIKHRLEVKRQQDGTIIIDDAFNSNPLGFRSAMHVMRVLADDREGRAILVTPGIVELGATHDEVHRALGMLAAEACDVTIVVHPVRIPTFIEGYKANDKGKTIQQFETFKEAEKWLIENKRPNDVILLENDLPDIYEQVLKI